MRRTWVAGAGGQREAPKSVVGQATSCQEHRGATGQREQGRDSQRVIWRLCRHTVDSSGTRVGQVTTEEEAQREVPGPEGDSERGVADARIR